MVKDIYAKILESKTYVLLLVVSLIALVACLIASIFGEMLWAKYLDFLSIQSGLGGARAIANDGVPKIVEAAKNDPKPAPQPYPLPTYFPPLD